VSGERFATAPHPKRQGPKRSPQGANDNSRRKRELVELGADYLFPDQIRERNTGRPFDPARWADGQERRDDLLRQSRWIADALEREGIRAREEADEACDIDHVLGTVTPVERFRAIKFLPIIMQRDSAAMLSALRYYMHNHVHGRYVRMATITGGARVPAFGPLRQRHDTMTRAISKWASSARLLYGVEVLFRAMEYTRDPGTPGDLETPALPPTYHEHAHVLFTPTDFMGEDGWSRFLTWSQTYLAARMPGALYAFHDCGRIEEPDEACKYPFKPGELSRCTDSEIAWLQAEFFRANIKQPMGGFRAFNRTMAENVRETGEMVESIDPETGEVSAAPRTVRAPLKIVTIYPEAGDGSPMLEIVHKRRKPQRGDRDQVREDDPDKSREPTRRENAILFTSNPTSSSCPWATVKSRVVGYTENPTTMAGLEGLHDLNCITFEVMKAWEARGAPPPLRIPLLMERDAAAMEATAAKAVSDSELWHEGRGEDPFSKHARTVREAATATKRARRLRSLAARLRASTAPTAPVQGASGAERPAYSVHTCSLTVPAFGDGEATGVPPETPDDWDFLPRSDFEPVETHPVRSTAPPAPPPVSEPRPYHTLPSARLRDGDSLLSAPLRVCAAVRDYEAWWQANRARPVTV
jgi:hypothetical protein